MELASITANPNKIATKMHHQHTWL